MKTTTVTTMTTMMMIIDEEEEEKGMRIISIKSSVKAMILTLRYDQTRIHTVHNQCEGYINGSS